MLYGAAGAAAFALILAIAALGLALTARSRQRRLAREFARFSEELRAIDARVEENHTRLTRIRAFQGMRAGQSGTGPQAGIDTD